MTFAATLALGLLATTSVQGISIPQRLNAPRQVIGDGTESHCSPSGQNVTIQYERSYVSVGPAPTQPTSEDTTSGNASIALVPMGTNGQTDRFSWTLTPLTASIDFTSKFAISRYLNVGAGVEGNSSDPSQVSPTPYCITQPDTSKSSADASGTLQENGTYIQSPLELQPCPYLEANLTVKPSQLFFLNCTTCEEQSSQGCRIASSMYANQCVTVLVQSGQNETESSSTPLLGLEACMDVSDGASGANSTQSFIFAAV